jgi:hypothetical protein
VTGNHASKPSFMTLLVDNISRRTWTHRWKLAMWKWTWSGTNVYRQLRTLVAVVKWEKCTWQRSLVISRCTVLHEYFRKLVDWKFVWFITLFEVACAQEKILQSS